MISPHGFLQKFGWDLWPKSALPFTIAHRGASDHAPENTLKAFHIAHELGAEMWEIDVRLAACGTLVVNHDANLERLAGDPRPIRSATAEALQQTILPDGQRMPTLAETIRLAKETESGLYIELKDEQSGLATWQLLKETGFRHAVIGAFDTGWVKQLRQAGCDWPLAILVPRGEDPIAYAAAAQPDIIHLCWEKEGVRPDRLITQQLVDAVHTTGAVLVAWHEERPDVVEALLSKPLLGICSNRPEMLKPARHSHAIQIVCHRGANTMAPENTLQAASICFDQCFDYVELDVRTTKDNKLIVMHDVSVDRTTDGVGSVRDLTWDQIRRLDAGGWFSDLYKNTPIPTLQQMLILARDHPHARSGLYIEIKDADPQALLKEVQAAHMQDRVFLWGADTDALRWLRQQSSSLRLMAPLWLYESIEKAHELYKAQIIEFDVRRDDLAGIAQCQSMGLKSMIYSQTDNWDELASYIKYKPDLVNLDCPDRFKLLADYPWLSSKLQAKELN